MTTAADYLRLIGSRAGDTDDESTAPARFDRELRAELVARLQAEIAYLARKTGTAADPAAVDIILAQARDGLSRLFGDGPDALLDAYAISGLEAVVRSDGSRPALLVDDDFVDVLAPSIGPWVSGLARFEDEVRQVCRSVGRVDDPSPSAALGYRGTAWVVADGLVATNYHVLDAIAPGGARRDGRFQGRLRTGVAVHFGHEAGDRLPDRRFPIRRVVGVGREGAAEFLRQGGLNFDGLDLAVLQLEPVPKRPFPPPLPLTPAAEAGAARNVVDNRAIYLVGFPGEQQDTTPELVEAVFGGMRGYKQLAPGVITATEVPGDPRGWMLGHDASTLGGNSGSAVVDLDLDGRTLLGLHVGGEPDRQNWAYALDRITADLAPHLPGGPP